MKDCRQHTEHIAQLADESITLDKTIHEDLTETFERRISDLEEKLAQKDSELKAIVKSTEGIIPDLKDTLHVKEATEEALRKQLGDKESEISNLWTSFNNLRDNTVEDTGVGLTMFEETDLNSELSFESRDLEKAIEELESQVVTIENKEKELFAFLMARGYCSLASPLLSAFMV